MILFHRQWRLVSGVREGPAFHGRDPIGMMEVTQEKILSVYKDVMGIQTAGKSVVLYDGSQAMEVEVTSVRYAESLDASTFAKP